MKQLAKKVFSILTAGVIMCSSQLFQQVTVAEAASSYKLTASMLSDSSLYYNNDLARVLAEFSHAAESESSDPIKQLYYDSGFEPSKVRSDYYEAGGCAYTVGFRRMKIDGKDTAVVLVTFRGSTSWEDFISDFDQQSIKDKLAEIGIISDNAYQELGPYKLIQNVSDFKDSAMLALSTLLDTYCPDYFNEKYKKLIITGHSLGGAGANAFAADFGYRINNKNDFPWIKNMYESEIYAYTFGAIKVLSAANTSLGYQLKYQNIHNIYNVYDSFGPNGQLAALGVSDSTKLFGHVDKFSDTGEDQSGLAAAHVMETYKKALDNGNVPCNGTEKPEPDTTTIGTTAEGSGGTDNTTTVQSTLRGDVNCDGSISPEDYYLFEDYLYKGKSISAQGRKNADMNQNGELDDKDDLQLLYDIIPVTKLWKFVPDCSYETDANGNMIFNVSPGSVIHIDLEIIGSANVGFKSFSWKSPFIISSEIGDAYTGLFDDGVCIEGTEEFQRAAIGSKVCRMTIRIPADTPYGQYEGNISWQVYGDFIDTDLPNWLYSVTFDPIIITTPQDTTTAPMTTTTTTTSAIAGDIDCNNLRDVGDAVLLARYLAEDKDVVISEQGRKNADCNKSGSPDSEDVVLILKAIARLITL